MIFNIIKTIHIISVISWMAGLLYLPRIFVYHADSIITKETSSTFKVMERKLYHFIMTPAAILNLGLLAYLMVHYIEFQNWLILKIGFVLGLSIVHLYCGKWVKLFAYEQYSHLVKFYGICNETPTILMTIIVILVIFKPF